MNKQCFLKNYVQFQNILSLLHLDECDWKFWVREITVVGLTILHNQTLEQVFVGDPQDDVTGVWDPSQEEVDLGGGDKRCQVVIPPQMFHRNKATGERKASLSHQLILI